MNERIRVNKDRGVRYRYSTDSTEDAMEFSFSLLCEVGEPFQAAFKELIEQHHLTIRTRELADAPYVEDYVFKPERAVGLYVYVPPNVAQDYVITPCQDAE